MKKAVVLLFAVIITFGLVGCAARENPEEEGIDREETERSREDAREQHRRHH